VARVCFCSNKRWRATGTSGLITGLRWWSVTRRIYGLIRAVIADR